MAGITWRDWCDESFAEARRTGRPLLLFLTASWCRFCRALEQSVLHEPEMVELAERLYVPLKVDKDRRPDINQRYNLGGWPTVAFLTPDGDLITGGSSLTDDEVRSLVRKVATYWKEHEKQIRIDVARITAEQAAVDRARQERRGEFSPAIVDRVAQAILEAFDARHGGFGTGQKFPHPEALDFAILFAAKTGNPAYRELVQKTLTEMAKGALFDPVDGGFFRYCALRDWQRPQTEKLLETQAGLLRNYLEAWQLFGRPDFRKVAQQTLSYLEHNLFDRETEAFFGSQDADDEYYLQGDQARRDRNPPRVDRTVYASTLSMAISSLLKAGSVLSDETATRRALGAARFLTERLWSAGRGVYHYYDGSRHILGLLADQIYAARALLHVVQYTGDNTLLPVVEDLLATIVKKQAATQGGFYDIPEENAKFGSLKRRQTSLLENGVIAEVLVRAHCLTARNDYLELAERTLRAFAADYPLYGYFTAGYARAVELFFHPPLRVVIVGRADDPRRKSMVERANRTWLPSKIVLALDPERDAELLARHEYPSGPNPVAFLCLERACVGEIADPDALPKAMEEAERRRTEREPPNK